MTKEKPWTSALQQKAPQLDSSMDTFVNLIDSIDQHRVFTILKQHCSLFSSQNYVNYNHLPKNPQTMTMNPLSIELQPSF